MKKLLTLITLILLILTLTACDKPYDRVIVNGGEVQQITSYTEIGWVVIVVTDKGIYVSGKDRVYEAE